MFSNHGDSVTDCCWICTIGVTDENFRGLGIVLTYVSVSVCVFVFISKRILGMRVAIRAIQSPSHQLKASLEAICEPCTTPHDLDSVAVLYWADKMSLSPDYSVNIFVLRPSSNTTCILASMSRFVHVCISNGRDAIVPTRFC